ncbi:MAG: hypothetical protein WCK63_14605 [Betaproteobacteria bacterium]
MIGHVLSWLLYPFAILFGLQVLEPRYVAMVFALALLLRRRQSARQLLAELTWVDLSVVVLMLLFAGLTSVTNSELLLRFYPAAMTAGVLLIFPLSLVFPPSMVERIARLSTPDLPPAGVRYTRRLTAAWCVFLVLNGVVSIYTAVYASQEMWALYNGFVAYLLMGALFSGEWLYRRYFFSRAAS